jgi:hypothetical protein
VEINEDGVVNPLRVPPRVRDVVARIVELPALARLFIVLAVIDLALAVLPLGSFYLYSVAGSLLVLLPVAVLWRNADAAVVTPGVVRGTVLIAVAEIAGGAFQALDAWLLADRANPVTNGINTTVVVRIVVVVAGSVGWWMVARALAELRPAGSGWRRVAGLIVGAAAVTIGVGFLAVELLAITGQDPVAVATEAIAAANWFVIAYVGWVLVTRAGGRPARATWSAALGAAIWLASVLPLLMITIAVLISRDDSLMSLQVVGIQVVGIGTVITWLLMLVAFATGLADSPSTDGEARRPAAGG